MFLKTGFEVFLTVPNPYTIRIWQILKTSKKTREKTSKIMFERGHERGRNVATNVAETWPTNWLIGHVVTWPACPAMLWAMFRPRWTWPKRSYKRGQNMTPLRRTWPETWPATWPRTVNERGPFTTNAASNVASNAGHVAGHVWSFSNFFRFFLIF